MHPHELDCYTLRELFRKIEGFNQVQMQNQRSQMEAARLTSWLVIRSMNGSNISPQSIVKFEWEKQEKPKKAAILSRDRRDFLVKKWKIR